MISENKEMIQPDGVVPAGGDTYVPAPILRLPML